MKRNFYSLIAVILLNSCAVQTEQAQMQAVDSLTKSAPAIVIQDELLNEPPNKPQFVIAQNLQGDAIEQALTESIRQQLLRLGYVEAPSREEANVVVWYSYESKKTGVRQVGQPSNVWGEQPLSSLEMDTTTVTPVSFVVQIISLPESRFPDQVITIWRGEWSSSLSVVNMQTFVAKTLTKVFDLYQSEQTQSQIAAFKQARERQLNVAINNYLKMIMYRIQSNWRKPRYNVKGKTCEVKIEQSAVGEIKSHKLLTCDKDRRFRKSIEKAIKESSPLPLPKHELFDRGELILIFQG